MVFRRPGNMPNKLHVFQRQLRLQPVDLRIGKGRCGYHEAAGGNQGHAAKHQYAGSLGPEKQSSDQETAKGGAEQDSKGKESGGGNHHPGHNRQRDTDQRTAQYDGCCGMGDMDFGMHDSY